MNRTYSRINVTYVTLLCAMTLMALYVLHGLSKGLFYPLFDYDECGQFFISQGLYHYSEPFSEPQGLGEVIKYNRFFNLDPGGFGILLHYWQMISTNQVWLRLAPFLFFCLAMVFAALLNYKENRSAILAVGTAVMLMTIPVISDLSIFYRAYTMEVCGVFLTLLLLVSFNDRLTWKRLLVLSLTVSFFMTSRYSMVPYSAAISAYVCLTILLNKTLGRNHKVTLIVVYALPVLLTLSAIYFMSMRYQNSEASSLTYMVYLGKTPVMLKNTWMSIRCYIIFGAVALLYANKQKISPTIWVCVILMIIMIVASLLNKYPWDERRALSLTSLQYYCLISLLCNIAANHRHHSCILALLIAANAWYFRQNLPQHEGYRASYHDYRKILENHKNSTYYVNWDSSPQLRYAFEHGSLKDYKQEFGYPQNFFFGNAPTHNYSDKRNTIPEVAHLTNPLTIDRDYYLFGAMTFEKVIERIRNDVNRKDFKEVKEYKYLYTRK